MNEALQQSIVEVVDLAKDGIIKSSEILVQQFPELCEQILTYGFWLNLSPIFLFIIFATTLIISMNMKRNYFLNIRSDIPTKLPFVIVSSVGTLASFMGICMTMPILLQIILAPKLYLIEYLGNLL